eukprot:Gregarina_sp_Poly_1__3205@NODE_1911_length_3099_cov_246_252639_g943_i1_p1_GENE_NODE_1911_length_3099_cov_246_252639_g943_i1NODE_1911_length_3099_cov_246_252639_g943_i1_p1_ORF_typecomplete_len714_score90_05Glycos_transf_2/PF00535_26/4_5e21Glyco_tranf_2_3/PF13641_6/5_3e21Glyco_transf_7C/PF02709_14/5_8e12Ricin_B_lectin/PF00652_22/1_3e07Glyco_tranf_2_2/PF10111_9/1_3e04Glyco_tranf_2_2/PF10111_9/0_00011Glyco_transf_21/PF13506_6/0_004Glyco_transf_21/PF13506_6/66RicinB_lectin_2/PF14200_6/0_00047_NODE_19
MAQSMFDTFNRLVALSLTHYPRTVIFFLLPSSDDFSCAPTTNRGLIPAQPSMDTHLTHEHTSRTFQMSTEQNCVGRKQPATHFVIHTPAHCTPGPSSSANFAMRRSDRRASGDMVAEATALTGHPFWSPPRASKAMRSSISMIRLLVVAGLIALATLVAGVRLIMDSNLTLSLPRTSPDNGSPPDSKRLLGLRKGIVPPPQKFVPALNMTLEQLLEAPESVRIAALKNIREGAAFLSPASDRMHGIVGLTDKGAPHWIPRDPPPEGLEMANVLREGGGFNLRLSDALPMDRSLQDFRHRKCKQITYDLDTLSDATVVIVFFNEPFSTLMRSVHSVLNFTPPQILREIVLVDDGSDLDWIRSNGTGELETYIALLPKVSLVRLEKRKGIVGARMAGIRAASAPIFVILDSHIEVEPGWLEPLVDRIGEDKSRILMPQVDGLDPETFEGDSGGIGCTLGFLWKMIEHGYVPDEDSTEERRNPGPTDFVTSPTMAGGLFAANVDFFLNEIGGYDEKFQFWGTENLELSFRLWQCGGRLECAPCSRVFHIFRKGGVGYSSPIWATTKNKLRTMAVWMDNYADLAWRVIGKPDIDFGTYDDLIQWKKEKKCHDFKWYLNTINPESFVQEIPRDVPRLGSLQNVQSGKCLVTTADQPVQAKAIMSTCTGNQAQDWMYFRKTSHIMPVANDELCLNSNNPAKVSDTVWCRAFDVCFNNWL